MIWIGKAMGINVYADTDDSSKANSLGMMISRGLRPDGKFDWDNETKQFIERLPKDAPNYER